MSVANWVKQATEALTPRVRYLAHVNTSPVDELMPICTVWRNTAPTAPEEKLLQEKHKLTTATL